MGKMKKKDDDHHVSDRTPSQMQLNYNSKGCVGCKFIKALAKCAKRKYPVKPCGVCVLGSRRVDVNFKKITKK